MPDTVALTTPHKREERNLSGKRLTSHCFGGEIRLKLRCRQSQDALWDAVMSIGACKPELQTSLR